MKILKFIWLFPAIFISIIYAIYVCIKVYEETGIVEMELMGVDNVVDEILNKILIPYFETNKIPLRIFSTLCWLTYLIEVYV